MKEQERFDAIEAENARLLSRMTKIMDAGPRMSVLHRTKVFISNAPTRRNEALRVSKLNEVVLERINKTGPYYDCKQWAKERKATEHILGGMGLYPYVPPPVKRADDFFEKDPLKEKSYEAKLDEQWATSLSAFAQRSSVLDEEFEKQDQGRRAVSLTPSSLKRPGNDDWMLPGLGRPGLYSHAKEGKTMQVIPDGRLPYQFTVRTPSPKQKRSGDSVVRPDSISKNVLIAKPAAPEIELGDEITLEKAPDRSGLKSREGRPTSAAKPTSASRPTSASAVRPTSANTARPMSATTRPTSATKAVSSSSRPSSATAAAAFEEAEQNVSTATNDLSLEVGEQNVSAAENDLSSEISATSVQGSEVIVDSTLNRPTSAASVQASEVIVDSTLNHPTSADAAEHLASHVPSTAESQQNEAVTEPGSADKDVEALHVAVPSDDIPVKGLAILDTLPTNLGGDESATPHSDVELISAGNPAAAVTDDQPGISADSSQPQTVESIDTSEASAGASEASAGASAIDEPAAHDSAGSEAKPM